MPQVILYLSPEVDKKVNSDSKTQKLSKIDILQKIIEEYYKGVKK